MPSINAKKKLLTERLQHFKNEINPEVFIDSLNCLIDEDKQAVESDQKNHGAISATRILVDRLRRRDKGFEQFVVALRDRGLDHVAQLLDPNEIVDPNDASATVEKDHGKFRIIGTAVDVVLSFQVMLDNERKVDFEEAVAKEYNSSKEEKSCKIRKEFKKREMPKGVVFVRTSSDKPSKKKPKNTKEASNDKDDSLDDTLSNDDSTCSEDNDNNSKNWEDSFKIVFRLSSTEVANRFWVMYESKELAAKIAEVLVESTLLKLELLDNDGEVTVDLNINDEDFRKILEFFEDKKSEQDVEMTSEGLLASRGPGNEGPDALDEIDIKIPEVLLESHRGHVQKRNLKLRQYQKELSQPAIEGRNTIICAPTNSGKTFVAMEIARLHLEKYKTIDRDEALAVTSSDTLQCKPKIIFIVSTQNLVLQQRQRFEDYLVDYSITDISGTNSTEIPLDFLLKTHDVIILTAQILLNALQKSTVNISQITLLVFDECHHTNKDHTYNKIMQHYMALKWDPDPDKNNTLPQIVGLTASLGVGRANETEKAKNHILQICANMDASCVSTVRENIEELERNVTGGVPKRRLEKVDQQPNVFEKVIVQIMNKIETAAQQYSTSRPPADRVSQQYRQWVEGLEKEAIGKGLRDLSTFAKHLRRYHIALVINDTVRIKDGLRYLQEYFDRLDTTKFQPTDKKLQELYEKATQGILSRIEKAEPENPKLVKLKELILNFHEEDKGKGKCGEAKGILFTKTRDSTKGIMGWIEETPELKSFLRPKVLVGAGDGEVGMTQGEQEAIIEEFKKSEVNILIATTVAEEGLDIGDCNFVIRYNMAGNEISSVQARGRIRADEGNYVYVGTSRDKGVNRERLNQYRESLMTMAVDDVQMIPHEQYMEKIKEIQKKDVRKYQMKNFLISKKVKANAPLVEDIIFYCRRCNTKACHLNEFRRLKDNYHVILEKNFKHRIHVKPKRVSKKIDDVLMDSQVHCKECDEDWGVTVKIDGFTWPCLKIRSFAVELPNRKRTTFKKWSDFHFEIPEATVSEIIDRDDTLDTDDLDLDV